MGNQLGTRMERAHVTGILSLEKENLSRLPAPLLKQLADSTSTLAPLLKSLNLAHNRLTQLPRELGTLRQLRLLDVSFNRLSQLGEEEALEVLARLQKLEQLQLHHNQLCHLHPASFQHLTSLRVLSLAGNQLTELPASLAHLTALKKLDVSQNQLKEIPSQHLQPLHATLEELNCADNQLQQVPPLLGTFQALTILVLDGNQIEHVPGTVLRDSRIKTISLERNPITTRTLMSIDGWKEYEQRRKGRVDQLLKTV